MNVVAEGQAIDEATEPARWLLASGEGGIGLTQTGALARSVVRDAAERWPSWWNAELFGPPHREADVAVLQALHEGLRRVRLLRRRGRQLMATARGRALAWQPATLLSTLGADLGQANRSPKRSQPPSSTRCARTSTEITVRLRQRHSRGSAAPHGADRAVSR